MSFESEHADDLVQGFEDLGGVAGVYDEGGLDQADCSVLLDDELLADIREGMQSSRATAVRKMTLMLSQVATPRQGKTVTIGTNVYRIERPLERDKFVVTLSVSLVANP